MDMVLKTVNLTKRYDTQYAVQNLNMNVERGKIYGLLGRNGAGKTVLFKTMIGFLKPTSGRVIVDGKEIGKDTDFADNIGIIIETPGFLSSYSGYKNLEYLASIKNMIGGRNRSYLDGANAQNYTAYVCKCRYFCRFDEVIRRTNGNK